MDVFDINTDLSTYSDDELAAHHAAIDAEVQRLFSLADEGSSTPPTQADFTRAQAGVGLLASIEGEQTARAANANAPAEMAALRDQRIAASQAASEPDADEPPPVEPEVDDPADDGDGAGSGDGDGASTGEGTLAAVTASAPARRSTVRQATAGSRPATGTVARRDPEVSLVAAADLAGFSPGQNLNLEQLIEAVNARFNGFPQFSGGNPMLATDAGFTHKSSVATFRKQYPADRIAEMGSGRELEVLEHISKEADLEGGSLLAAGGWCAPSETDYTLCTGETTDGLIDLPEFGVRRGGIKTTTGPDFTALYNAGFTQTEAQNIAATVKPCYTVPCPTFTDNRLDAMGICVKAGLLQDAAWPELTRRVISGVLVAHQHRVSAALIGKMVTAAGAAIAMTNTGSATANILDSIAVVIETTRQDYRLGLNQTLEVVLPFYAREVIRADLAMRTGVEMLAVTDQQINSYFSVRKARPQWVYNWQALTAGQEGWPATMQILVYPAGTFSKGGADIITLDAVYDAASLSVNDYTGLFTEEGVLLATRCYQARLLTVQLGVTGRTGANDVTQATPTAGSFTLV